MVRLGGCEWLYWEGVSGYTGRVTVVRLGGCEWLYWEGEWLDLEGDSG